MNDVIIECPNCNKKIVADKASVGKSTLCPLCHTFYTLSFERNWIGTGIAAVAGFSQRLRKLYLYYILFALVIGSFLSILGWFGGKR